MFRRITSLTVAAKRPFSSSLSCCVVAEKRRGSVLEVESKFTPSAVCTTLLLPGEPEKRLITLKNGTDLYFERQQGPKLICDTYYDFREQLQKAGIYVRKRKTYDLLDKTLDSKFVPKISPETIEAKMRCSGDFLNSQMEEFGSEEDVQGLVSVILPKVKLENLHRQAAFDTLRYEWDVTYGENEHESFRVCIDRVAWRSPKACPYIADLDFFHIVGEVELVAQFDGEKQATVPAQSANAKGDKLTDMQSKVNRLMGLAGELFVTEPKPKGKLTAYYELVRRVRKD